MEKIIKYFSAPAKIACDERCDKAWGINNRPKIEFDENNPDDYAYLSDDELGTAPAQSPITEGGDNKPLHKSEIPNRWCIRECERCAMSEYGESTEPLELPDFSQRQYNMPWKHNGEI